MSLNPHPRAGKLRLLFCRIVALVSIAALITPSILIVSTRTVRAANSSPSVPAPPISSPPQPFHVGTATEASIPLSLISLEANLIGWTASLFETEPPPKEFVAPKAATISESVPEKLSSVLGLIAPSLARKREEFPSAVLPSQPAAAVDFDFDGDGKSDLSRWHPGTTEFKIHNSSGGSYSTYTIGSSSAKLAPADYDGDGKTDVAFFNAGTWTIRYSSTGSTSTITGFGQSGDIPVSGNYGGSSADDLALYRPSNGYWYWREVGNSTVTTLVWGNSTDIPVPGDYDGDGKMDPAIYRTSDHTWYVLKSSSSYTTWDITGWGNVGDIPIQADFDGDGKTDPTIYRPSDGGWWTLKSSTSYSTYSSATWGNYGDQPVAGDFDGDGKADIAVWRPTTGYWFIYKSANGSVLIEPLGTLGDTAVLSTYVKQIGGGLTPDQISQTLLSPKNATGGANLYSQNFSWGTNLVSLPGRAGLDLGLGISYNSLIWTKVGSAMVFNDSENITPGFTLDFPKIEPAFYDDVTDRFVYMMVTPSGGREAFRQTTVSNVYETYDSTYAQLTTTGASNPNDPPEGITIKVKSTDGTTLDYVWNYGAYRCVKVTDRNGNYLTVTYSDNALVSITDTLGRVVTINYSAPQQPSSITQTWKDSNGSGSNVTHTWASFSYTTKTIATDFDSSLAVIGPPNGTVLTVLDRVTYADGSSTKFYYNGYAQVWKIENIAADSMSHVLNRVRTNFESPGANQLDCPKLTDTWNWVENFNQDIYGTAQETHTTNSVTTGSSYSLPGSLSGSATKIEVSMAGDPYNSVSKTFVSPSGWSEGLPLVTEDWADGTSGSERKRWTYTGWTQDHESLAYMNNPRAEESRVGDTTNIKRTTTSYYKTVGDTQTSLYGLVSGVKVYDTDLTTVLKEVDYQYDLDSAYTSRRIIGLPSEVDSYGRESSGLNLMSKVTYAYDEGNFSDTSLYQNITPTQHDDTNYGSSFVYRGNTTSTTRWNVDYPTNSSYATFSIVKYNTAGSPVSQTTSWDGTNTQTVRIGYGDNFNSTVSSATYAYPTTITDPAGSSLGDTAHSSTVKYRYDIGANVEANSPAPTGQSYGKRSVRLYDSVGRIQLNSIYINTTEHSYVRYEYPTNGVESLSYATIVDTNANGPESADEVTTESWTDGAGRVLKARSDNPGSSGLFSGVFTEYDILGRVKRQSVPTEINSSWTAYGDDYTRGFLWTYQKYDWKGRVVRKINTDGVDSSTLNDSDVLISYEGCGCAGGQVTTIQGENIIENNWSNSSPTTKGRRTQKITEDILGRTIKTETMEWDGSTVNSTAVNKYNGLDQVIQSIQYVGTEDSSHTHQTTTMTYDGFGRGKTKHSPQQDASAATTYNYNPDDSISSAVDARGATISYTYNNRKLVEGVSYSVPTGSGIPVPTSLEFGYDDLGNRTYMTDGLGRVDYEYDELSEMTAETRDFDDTLANAPISGSKFRLEYTYGLNGQLKSLKDPYGQEIDYAYDKAGRLSSVDGAAYFAGVTNYASDPHYRAWGGLQSLSYGNSTAMSVIFDNRLHASHSEVAKSGVAFMSKDYSFYSDGSLRKSDDLIDDKFDRLNTFDSLGHMATAKSGLEARGTTATGSQLNDLPYRQSYTFDAFSNMTARNNLHWGNDVSESYTFTNNRVTNSSLWTYDADGRETGGYQGVNYVQSTYDATGQLTFYNSSHGDDQDEITRYYDGNGREEKRHERQYLSLDGVTWQWVDGNPTYYIRSTVLGGEVVSDTDNLGRKIRTYVRAAGSELAWQNGTGTGSNVSFQAWDAAGMSYRTSDSSGTLYDQPGYEGAPAEMDPTGSNIGKVNPYITESPGSYCVGCGIESENMTMFVNGRYVAFSQDGIPISVNRFRSMIEGREFDLLMMQANMSNRLIGVGVETKDGLLTGGPTFLPAALQFGAKYGENVWGLYESSWLPQEVWAVSVQTRQGPKIGPGVPSNIRTLVSDLAKRKDCADILNKFAEKLGKMGPLDATEPGKTFIESVFDNLKWIKIDDEAAGSGASTVGGAIFVHSYGQVSISASAKRAAYASYVLQEMVHNFRSGRTNTFDDKKIDVAARQILDEMDSAVASNIRGDFTSKMGKNPTDGYLAHYLIKQYCQYSQQEVDSGQPK